MKLDAKLLRYLSADEFRVLTAVEMGSKNHELVPSTLVAQISKLKSGGTFKVLGELAKHNLVARVQNAKYDGYRLTYGGYDYLALHTFAQRGTITSVGNQIGVGKESDIYIVADEHGHQRVLKIHRLGRTSFRAIKTKRDYLESRKSASWMYMSRLAATKEYAFMKALYEHNFPVPTPHDQNRHMVVMDLVDGVPMTHVANVADVGTLYAELMKMILRLAAHGLIHGDFNEFNLLVRARDQFPFLIDFPQMISTRHPNAKEQFDRDVTCVRDYFRRRYDFNADWWPEFDRDVARTVDLDQAIAASGALRLTKKQMRELESFLEQQREEEQEDQVQEGGSDVDDEDNEDGSLALAGLTLAAPAPASAPATAAGSDDEEDEEPTEPDAAATADMPNNHMFRAFRDQDWSDFQKAKAARAAAAAAPGKSGDYDDGQLQQQQEEEGAEETASRAPRLVKAPRALTAEEIKERVSKVVAKKGSKGGRNSNKNRTRKDRNLADALSVGKGDY
ncbi:RIO1 family-domain-containing protein [Blastocladiella britannica]|nr:RIO1 family-domain-containing protein [Blastocladiella britannica]